MNVKKTKSSKKIVLKITMSMTLRSAQAGPSRALAFGSPPDERDEAVRSCHKLLLSDRSAILRTPTKITGLPHDGKAHVMR